MLEHLRHYHLGGSGSVRRSIEDGFAQVYTRLDPAWRDKVARALSIGGREGWNSEGVSAIFREDS